MLVSLKVPVSWDREEKWRDRWDYVSVILALWRLIQENHEVLSQPVLHKRFFLHRRHGVGVWKKERL